MRYSARVAFLGATHHILPLDVQHCPVAVHIRGYDVKRVKAEGARAYAPAPHFWAPHTFLTSLSLSFSSS